MLGKHTLDLALNTPCWHCMHCRRTYDLSWGPAMCCYLATVMSSSVAWEKAPTSAPSCSFSLVPYASRYSTSAILSIKSILMLFGISIRNTHLQSSNLLSELQTWLCIKFDPKAATGRLWKQICGLNTAAYWCNCWTMSSRASPFMTCMSESFWNTAVKGSFSSQCAQVDMSSGNGLPVLLYTAFSSTVFDAMWVDCRRRKETSSAWSVAICYVCCVTLHIMTASIQPWI